MVGRGKRKIEAIGYMRTSSATNVGRDKDSEARQRAAIESYAKAAGYTIVDWFYDPAVKGSDAVTERPGFKDMLDRIASNSVRTLRRAITRPRRCGKGATDGATAIKLAQDRRPTRRAGLHPQGAAVCSDVGARDVAKSGLMPRPAFIEFLLDRRRHQCLNCLRRLRRWPASVRPNTWRQHRPWHGPHPHKR